MRKKNKPVVAIMYDFDKTLCTKDMQEYTFIPNVGLTANEFWAESNQLAKDKKMDGILAYMHVMLEKAHAARQSIRREEFVKMGKDLEFFPGVVEWFERINRIGCDLDLNIEHYIISCLWITCFDHLMIEVDVVDFLINLDDELKQTYLIYQDLLYALKKKNYSLLNKSLHNYNVNISSYMKTSIKTLLEFLPFIKNTFNNNYHNGYIEGNNNFIKVIKRIAFGFRNFSRFKARIMICKGLLKIKKIANA